MSIQNTASLLWLGAGDIAERCYPSLAMLGLECSFVSRSAKPEKEHFIKADLAKAGDALTLAELRPDYCVMSFSPKGRRLEDYEQAYLRSVENMLTSFTSVHHKPRLVLFVSSTSVYPQHEGELVDEESSTESYSVSSSTMLACEELLLKQKFPVCALRFSGIYGPNRYRLLAQVRAGKYSGQHFTNRIHVKDCASVITFLLERAMKQMSVPKVLLASDNEPVMREDLSAWFKNSLNFYCDENEERTSDGGTTDSITGKRCNNTLLRSLGYQFKVPSYKEGFPEIVDAYKAQP